MQETKRCPRCAMVKPVAEFSRKAANKDGFQSRCKSCISEYLSGYYVSNKARLNDQSRRNYSADKVGRRLTQAKWDAANAARLKAAQRSYYEANRERIKARVNGRYAEKSAAIRAKQIARNAANPEKRRAIDNRMRAKRSAAPGAFTGADVGALMTLQRGKCVACRVGIRDEYHVDHIEPLAKGGTNDRINLQLLCPTCNRQKHARNPVEFMQAKGFLL